MDTKQKQYCFLLNVWKMIKTKDRKCSDKKILTKARVTVLYAYSPKKEGHKIYTEWTHFLRFW